jgi:hypothetical protein
MRIAVHGDEKPSRREPKDSRIQKKAAEISMNR